MKGLDSKIAISCPAFAEPLSTCGLRSSADTFSNQKRLKDRRTDTFYGYFVSLGLIWDMGYKLSGYIGNTFPHTILPLLSPF